MELEESRLKFSGGLTIEAINCVLANLTGDGPVNALVEIPLVFTQIFQYVEHFGHLTEDQDPVAVILQFPEHLLEQNELSSCFNQCIRLVRTVQILGGFQGCFSEEKWMIAAMDYYVLA